jgi:nucleotide sugar dehydrogenase
MRVAVIALGKIGLPLAVQIAGKGFATIGSDISSPTVDLINGGNVPFPGEVGLSEQLRQVVGAGMLTAVTDNQLAARQSDVIVVVVPLAVDNQGEPDFSAIDAATVDIGDVLRRGQLISYETTLPVGTTRNRFGPMLEKGSGLKAGEDFHLVHSPERVYSGRVFADLRRYPKLVGGVSKASAKAGVTFYESILDFGDRPDLDRPNGVWNLGSSETAELAKLAETTYRDVNIALANEFARFAEQSEIDIYQVIEAANSQPFSHIHRPGIAVGGHCIPVYPRFYLSGDPAARLPAVAREVNLAVPGRAIQTVSDALGGLAGEVVVVLGVSYRGGVKEAAFSGVWPLVKAISGRGGLPLVHDPLFTTDELKRMGLNPWDGERPVAAAIVQADHQDYRDWKPDHLPGVRVVYDGRGVLDPALWGTVTMFRIGRPLPG